MSSKKKPLQASEALKEKISKETLERLFDCLVVEGNRRSNVFWDIPRKFEQLGNFYTEFAINLRWGSYLDPIVVSMPYRFNTDNVKKELLTKDMFVARTEIYLSSDHNSIVMKYPLPMEPKGRSIKYLIVDMPFVGVSNLFDLITKVEDHLDLFKSEVTQISYNKLEELLNGK